MKNIKLFCLFALTALAINLIPGAAWSAVTGTLQDPNDACVVDPSAIVAPVVHPKKKYVHLHTTPQTKARLHALAALHRHDAGLIPVSINICPPTPKAPLTCRDTLGASAHLTAPDVEAMLTAAGYNGTPSTLTYAMVLAMHQHPDAAPALFAYALQHTNTADKTAVAQLTQAAYAAAPGQAAALAYAGTLSNPDKSAAVNQTLLASAATPADKTAILNCSVIDIKTGAFVPALAQPELSAINPYNIRNDINNAVGTTTLIPGLPAREKDDSAT